MFKKVYNILLLFFCFQSPAQLTNWVDLTNIVNGHCLVEEGDDIWIGGGNALIKYNKLSGNKIFYDKTNTPFAPNGDVNRIIIDSDGVKWIATNGNGLIRYDGMTWQKFSTSNSGLLSNFISKLVCDQDNNLWMANSNGLLKFDGSTWTIYNTSNSSLPSGNIYMLYADGNDIWVGTNVGLSKFDGVNWTHFNTSNSNINTSSGPLDMTKDRNGNFWILHYSFVEKFDGINSFINYNNSNTNLNCTLLRSIACDTNNTIWVGYNGAIGVLGGIKSFDGINNWISYDSTNTNFSANNIDDIIIGENNEPYGVSSEGLLHNFNLADVTNVDLRKLKLKNSFVRNIAFDENENPVIGTRADYNKSGLYKYDWDTLINGGFFNDTSINFTSNKFGNFFIKNSRSIYKCNGSSWTLMNGYPSYYIPQYLYGDMYDLSAMDTDTLGGLWTDYMATFTISSVGQPTFREGLAHYNGSVWAKYSYTNSAMPNTTINKIRIDQKNSNVWLSTPIGLVKFDGVNWSVYTPTNPSIPTNIDAFDVDSIGNVWFTNGTGGFIKFDGINWIDIPYPSPVSNYFLEIIRIDKKGVVWVYGLNGLSGVRSFDGLNWRSYPVSPNSISIDKYNNKWFGCYNGVQVFREDDVYVTSVEENKEPSVNILIYPNPFYKKFNVKLLNHYNTVNFSLYNIFGQEVLNLDYENAANFEISTDNLPRGIYIYKCKTGDYTRKGKIVAE